MEWLKFGQKAKLSKVGLEHFKHEHKYNSKTRGVMVGKIHIKGKPVRIVRKGHVTAQSYHWSLWTPAPPDKGA